VEFHDHAHSRQVTRLCADKGLLVVPTRNGVVRLIPDLLVAETDIEAALAMLRGVLAEL
jgi:acetylornithine/succinyldiaminopimelate/putrescine aminotransferase